MCFIEWDFYCGLAIVANGALSPPCLAWLFADGLSIKSALQTINISNWRHQDQERQFGAGFLYEFKPSSNHIHLDFPYKSMD